MRQTISIIKDGAATATKPVLAFSGGTDSLVLLHILYTETDTRPPLVFCDTGMEYPETLPHIKAVAAKYQAELLIARPDRRPLDVWKARGWPFLGKLPARTWTRKHKDRAFGFKLDVSSCCQILKLNTTRNFIKSKGFDLTFTGMRGSADDAMRGLRQFKDGPLYRDKQSKTWQCHPLLGWTDLMIRRYTQARNLPRHPLKDKGLITTGCMYCGGGCQFTNSGYPILRSINYPAWRRFFVDWKAGEIMLAIKYDRPLRLVREAVNHLGGLEAMAKTRPWIFDFSRLRPLKGYNK